MEGNDQAHGQGGVVVKVLIYTGGTRNSEGVRGCTSVFFGRDALGWLIPGWPVAVKLKGLRAGMQHLSAMVIPIKVPDGYGHKLTVLMRRSDEGSWFELSTTLVSEIYQNWHAWGSSDGESRRG